MPATLLDGKALAAKLRADYAARVAASAIKPGLAVVLVGDNPASASYVRNKRKACGEVGVVSFLHHLPADTPEADLLRLLADLTADPAVHGILVQLPLPAHIREAAVIDAVGPDKDVDCFHPENVGRLAAGHPRFRPCTPAGCVELLLANGIEVNGREVVVVGRSNIVGKPLALLLMQKPLDATVTVAHTGTRDLAAVCRRADILIAAAGRANLITPDMVQPGAAVVDVGTNPGPGGRLVGDVAAGVHQVAGWLSPVPGGVGPMTITMLLENTLRSAGL
jgi:methylenetetrahydrofolate dehydrogenase (NADP+)/methenyltetrahydrofolate cyclohydrolase